MRLNRLNHLQLRRRRSDRRRGAGLRDALVVLTLHYLATCLAADGAMSELDPAAPYGASISDPVTHTVDFRVIVTPPYHCELLKVWLPLPQSDAGQTISDSRLSTFPMEVEPQVGAEPVYGNRFAYFEFHHPEGAQIIQHQFTAVVSELQWHVNPAEVREVHEWPATFEPYLQPQSVEDQSELDTVLQGIREDRTGSARLLAAIDWVDANLEYDHVRASLRADANHAFALRRGHCSDYHGLCATMGRALGSPTRVTYGLSLFPKNSPSHCKLEAFLPGYGWVSYDVSETQKLIAKIGARDDLSAEAKARLTARTRERLHSGFRENSWLLLTKGTGYDLVPPARRPVDVVRTIYAEADGVPLPDPDPANRELTSFSWMTAHRYVADRPFKKPFSDLSTLE
ncbi:MAG: transglutaminase-like domain-containing protein [Planctomycetaceae bacterium]